MHPLLCGTCNQPGSHMGCGAPGVACARGDTGQQGPYMESKIEPPLHHHHHHRHHHRLLSPTAATTTADERRPTTTTTSATDTETSRDWKMWSAVLFRQFRPPEAAVGPGGRRQKPQGLENVMCCYACVEGAPPGPPLFNIGVEQPRGGRCTAPTLKRGVAGVFADWGRAGSRLKGVRE